MNIIILGAGQVGSTLAETLVKEGNDITVVDTDEKRLRALQNRLDIRTITGLASHPDIMEIAGSNHADMVIAVTSSDETNMIACQIAHTLFHTPTKIARIRSNGYLTHPELFNPKALPIDVCIYPEQLVTDHIKRMIEYPGALQVLDFAGGKLQLIAIRPQSRSPLVGKNLNQIHEYVGRTNMRIVAIFRANQSIQLSVQTEIRVGDEVFFIAPGENTQELLKSMTGFQEPYRNIVIGGGGQIGLRLAASLEQQYSIKVIDNTERFAERAAESLRNSTVLFGDVCDRELLLDENIEDADVFCAVTNDDEANIMSCIQAKRLGVRKVMALIARATYVDLIEGGEVDIAISPQQVTTGSILTYLRKGDIAQLHSLRRGAAEAIEIIVHGDNQCSKVIGRSLAHIKFPPGTTVGAVIRNERIMIAQPDLVIEPDDHLVIFLVDKSYIHDVEKLFHIVN